MTGSMDKYKQLYFSEAEEKLIELEQALLELEKKPGSTAPANDAMRAAHTFKSSSAAMGFTQISELSHAMESFFETVRSKKSKRKLSAVAIDLLFSSLDALKTAVDQIKSGQEDVDLTAQITKLQADQESPTSDKKNVRDDTPEVDGSSSPVVVDKSIELVKVNGQLLDSLMNLTEELLVERMRLEQVTSRAALSKLAGADLKTSVDHISRLISDLQYTVTQTHLVPLGQLFERFPRLIRDLAKDQGKKVDLALAGQDIELDRAMIDRLGEPLIHLLRNAVDHGILASTAGQRGSGEVKISATREPDRVVIVVHNGGVPINWVSVAEAALDRGIINPEVARTLLQKAKTLSKGEDRKSDDEITNLIFHPQLSTKKKVTKTSGRGVGLAIVKTVVEGLGGTVTVKSGSEGTTFYLSLPLTVAIVQALLLKAAGSVFALPFSQVDRLVQVLPEQMKRALDHDVAVVDEQDIPVIHLQHIFKLTQPDEDKKNKKNKTNWLMIVTKSEKTSALGLVVDEVLAEQDIVIKPLTGVLKSASGLAGVTLLGDGRPALILDVAGLPIAS